MRHHRWFAPAVVLTVCATAYAWNSYRRLQQTPSGHQPTTPSSDGANSLPIPGDTTRSRDCVTRPVERIDRVTRPHGEVVPIRYGHTDLDRCDGDNTVRSLPVDHCRVGPVLGSVPGARFRSPRYGHESVCRALELIGRRILAGLPTPDHLAALSTALFGDAAGNFCRQKVADAYEYLLSDRPTARHTRIVAVGKMQHTTPGERQLRLVRSTRAET